MLQQRKSRLREGKQLVQWPSNKWWVPIPGVMAEWEPLRVFGQEHNQDRLGKERHLGKLMAVYGTAELCKPELLLCKMELRMQREA